MNSLVTKIAAITLVLSMTYVPTAQAQIRSVSDAVAKIDSMIAEMTLLKTQLQKLTAASAPTPQVQGVQSASILTMDLSYGATNEDIAKVQRLLATDSEIYPYGVDSGFFGPKTQAAIRAFQTRFNLDAVGVIGPATTALLELFMAAYPDENYPPDVLQQSVPAPQVQGASATAPSQVVSTVTTPVGKYSKIQVTEDNDEFIVRSYLKNGDRNRDILLYPEDEDELIEMLAKSLNTSKTEVASLVEVDEDWFESTSSGSSRGADEGDAKDAIDDADDALDRLRDLIEDAEDDDVDVDDAEDLYDEGRDLLSEAEDAMDDEEYDDAVDLAKEAEEMADEAEDELDDAEEASEEIDSIEAEVREDETRVTVEYENGDEEDFDVEETDREDVIAEIADELNIDEDEVEDLIEFEYGDIDRVTITITDDKTRVRIYFDSGFDLKYTTDEDDEDKIIEEVADEFDLDEDELEKYADVIDQR